jgi:L-alanine-DL-glutamate epimerase-like enolase superfamily enzyme
VVRARWRAPLRSAHAEAHAAAAAEAPRPLVLLGLEGADGMTGHGEAAPLESYDGVSLDAVLGALDACAPVLAAARGDDPGATLEACRSCTDLPQALAAIDLALWDLAGRRLGRPVWQLLADGAAPRVAVNAVVGAVDPGAAAAEAAAAVAAGFTCVKLKIGVGDDLARVRAVRAAIGTEVALRLDANGAYAGPEAALSALAELAAFTIELCEEPVHGARALATVAARSPILVAADESTTDPELFRRRCTGAVCLKIAAAGGISGVLDEAARARALGYEVYLASTLDGPLGIAAALHAAARVAPERPNGLATLERYDAVAPFRADAGYLSPPPGPGLGNRLLDWYR